MPRILKSILTLIGGIVAVYLVFVGILAWQLRTITSVSQYEEVLENWKPEFVQHFPESIPPQAKNIHLSYFPGFLQGGAHLQLRVTMPTERMSAEEDRLLSSAIATFEDGRILPFVPNLDGIQDMPSPPFYTADESIEYEFPGDFKIYVLFAAHGSTDGFPWNHGNTNGFAVSHERSELVYWAESW